MQRQFPSQPKVKSGTKQVRKDILSDASAEQAVQRYQDRERGQEDEEQDNIMSHLREIKAMQKQKSSSFESPTSSSSPAPLISQIITDSKLRDSFDYSTEERPIATGSGVSSEIPN
jgi:hypothetical protein